MRRVGAITGLDYGKKYPKYVARCQHHNVNKNGSENAISRHHNSEIVDIIKSKPKLDSIKLDDFSEVQAYFKDMSIENVRLGF